MLQQIANAVETVVAREYYGSDGAEHPERLTQDRTEFAGRQVGRKRTYFVTGRFMRGGIFEMHANAYDIPHATRIVVNAHKNGKLTRAADELSLEFMDLGPVAEHAKRCPRYCGRNVFLQNKRIMTDRNLQIVTAIAETYLNRKKPVPAEIVSPSFIHGEKAADALFTARRKCDTQLKAALKSFKPADADKFTEGFVSMWNHLAENAKSKKTAVSV